MITSNTFLCQLTERQQKEILATLKENLINEGFNEIEIQKMLNSAKENRLVDLEEYMNIEFFIEKYKTENNTVKDIRILIKEYRERNGYSIKELSELIGVSKELFQKFEEEEHALSNLDLIKLIAVFGRDFELEVNKALAKSKQYGDEHKNDKISLMNLFVPKASEQDNEEDELHNELETEYYKGEIITVTEKTRISELSKEQGRRILCAFEHYLRETGYMDEEMIDILKQIELGTPKDVESDVDLSVALPVVNDELETEYDKQEIYYKKKYEELLATIKGARTKVKVIDERGTVCGFELGINEHGNIVIRKGTEITCYESNNDEWHDDNGDYQILEVKCNYK